MDESRNYLFTRDMIEGPLVGGSIEVSGAFGGRAAVSVSIEISYDGSISETARTGVNQVRATSLTIKAGASVGADALPGPGGGGNVRWGHSTSAWHPSDLLKK